MMDYQIQNLQITIKSTIDWLRFNANMTKALNYAEGAVRYREMVYKKVLGLHDQIQQFGQMVLKILPDQMIKINSLVQYSQQALSLYISKLMNPNDNAARVFLNSSDELKNMIMRVEEILRLSPPLAQAKAEDAVSLDIFDTLTEPTTSPTPLPLIPSPNSMPLPSSKVPLTDLPPPPSQTPTTTPIPSIESLPTKYHELSSLTSLAPPPVTKPRVETSANPAIDKVLELKHNLSNLKEETIQLREYIQQITPATTANGPVALKTQLNSLSNEYKRLQARLKTLETERNELTNQLITYRNQIAQMERGSEPTLTPLYDQINTLIQQRNYWRREATDITFQKIEEVIATLKSQVATLIEEQRLLLKKQEE